MKVTTITYDRQLCDNNYGSIGLSVTAELEPGDDPTLVLHHLHDQAIKELTDQIARRREPYARLHSQTARTSTPRDDLLDELVDE